MAVHLQVLELSTFYVNGKQFTVFFCFVFFFIFGGGGGGGGGAEFDQSTGRIDHTSTHRIIKLAL